MLTLRSVYKLTAPCIDQVMLIKSVIMYSKAFSLENTLAICVWKGGNRGYICYTNLKLSCFDSLSRSP